MKKLIFVYGTLKNGMSNNDILQGLTKNNEASYLFPAETIEKYPLYHSEHYFPYLEDQPGVGHIIQGEVWEVSDKAMKILDTFEGVPVLYKRGLIEIEAENHRSTVGVYFKTDSTAIDTAKCIEEWTE